METLPRTGRRWRALGTRRGRRVSSTSLLAGWTARAGTRYRSESRMYGAHGIARRSPEMHEPKHLDRRNHAAIGLGRAPEFPEGRPSH